MFSNPQSILAIKMGICCLFLSLTVHSETEDIERLKTTISEKDQQLIDKQELLEFYREQNKKLKTTIEEYQSGDVPSRMDPEKWPTERVSEFNEEIPIISAETNQMEPSWHFSVTPRTALRINTFRTASTSIASLHSEEPALWTNGGTISVTTPWLPKTSFLFTGLYGEDSGKIEGISGAGRTIKGEFDEESVDLELLARTQISDVKANWLIGFQYLSFDINQRFIADGIPIGQLNPVNTEIYLLKIGLGGHNDLSRHHRLFSNLILGAGVTRFRQDIGRNRDTWGSVGGDINIGYEWIADETFSISPRYRAQFVYQYDVGGDTGFDDQFFILHGPELHFTARF